MIYIDKMVSGLIIFQDGSREIVEYTERDFVSRFNRLIRSRGAGAMECFDMMGGEDGLLYMFYGWVVGYDNFNREDFPTTNPYGDVVIVALNSYREPVDINEEIIDIYIGGYDDLDDFIDEDYEEDDDDSGSDLLDFIDYGDEDD